MALSDYQDEFGVTDKQDNPFQSTKPDGYPSPDVTWDWKTNTWDTGGGGDWFDSNPPPEVSAASPPSGSGFQPGRDNRPNPSDYGRPGVPDLANFRSPDPLRPWEGEFSAPTMEQASAEPGFQFALGEGLKALERSSAAKGTLLTGGAGKGLVRYGNEFANKNYGNVYDRAYNEYEGKRTNFLNNEMTRFNSQRANLGDQFGFNESLFGMNRTNRMDDYGIASNYFDQGQAQRRQDFDIYSIGDMNTFTKLLETARLKKPVSPYSVA